MLVGEKPGGHAERSIAIGTIETALWDAIGKAQDLPTAEVLARRYRGGTMQRKVSVYVGGGWYRPGGVPQDVADEIRGHQAAGYTHVKIKVGGASLDEDLRRIDCALSVLPDSSHLAVDANCKFQRDEALVYAKALAPYDLRWFEEPCDPNDYSLMAELASVYAPPLAVGENLYGNQEVTNLVRLGGWRSEKDLIQVDPPQSYGLHAFASMALGLEAQGWGPAAISRTAATRCRWRWWPAWASAVARPIPACSAPSAALPTTRGSRTASCIRRSGPASASRATARCMR